MLNGLNDLTGGAGSAEVQIVVSAVDNASSGILGVNSALGVLTAGAAVAMAAVGAISAAIVTITKTTMDWGTSLKDTTMKMGDTTGQAAGLTLASDAVGISVDTVTQRMMLMEKGLETSALKIGTTGKMLTDLGISWKNANGTMMDSTTLLQSVADWFVRTTDVTQRNNAEMTIFGRNGAALDMMLTNIANGGMADFNKEAQAFNLNIGENQMNNIEKLSEGMNIFKDAIKGVEITLGTPFTSVLKEAVTWIENLTSSLMPAVTQFGGFLDVLFGGTAHATTPPSSPGGRPATYSAQQANYDFWASQPHKVGETNPYAVPATGGGGGPNSENNYQAIPVGAQGGMPSGAITPFETAIDTALTGIKADTAIIATALGRLDWGKFGDTINRVFTQLFPAPLPSGSDYSSGPGGKVYYNLLEKPVLQFTGNDWQTLFMQLADKMGVPQKTISDNTTSNNNVNTTLGKVDTTLVRLPPLIGAAVRTAVLTGK